MPTLKTLLRIADSQMHSVSAQSIGLSTLQSLVGGLIEPVFTVPSVDRPGYYVTGYANEEGIVLGLAPNVFCYPHEAPIRGPVVILGLDPHGESCELTENELGQIGLYRVDGMDLPILEPQLIAVGGR